jgi:hypothetical protein
MTVYQRPQDLVLGVTDRDVSHRFQILKRADVQTGALYVRFHIIGESHFVTVQNGGATLFHEILACVPLRADECWHLQRFSTLDAHFYRREAYQVEVTFGAKAVAMARSAQMIEVQFPRVYGVTPVTRVSWKQTRQRLYWWTLHTYPERAGTLYVQTASQVELD